MWIKRLSIKLNLEAQSPIELDEDLEVQSQIESDVDLEAQSQIESDEDLEAQSQIESDMDLEAQLGYAVFLLELLLKKNSDRQMHISYDIACLLKKHLEFQFSTAMDTAFHVKSELLDEKALDVKRRLEKTLSAFERKHKTSRLPSNAANYLKSIRLVKLKQKKLQLVTVKKHVAERHYLLKLLHKYCNNSDSIFSPNISPVESFSGCEVEVQPESCLLVNNDTSDTITCTPATAISLPRYTSTPYSKKNQ
ncbi:unnamed protein product [Mytilus edulis]|uniref:Uncharacterized protein n=1 Tax=Mytilus edulis TaxID=6550 RepID=A0A8S3PX04_MYTED|nr:unnamed protein product [Mytilus edulis]